MRISNNSNINLALAVWLLDDTYDYVKDVDNYISATALMKPLKQILIPPRIPANLRRPPDVEEFISRRMGHAIHDSVEHTWTDRYRRPLELLGYPAEVIENIRINPTDEEVRASNSIIPIYLEQRELRQITVDGVTYTIGGKFDFVGEGIVQDFKSTSAWSWIKNDKDATYALQLSIYRWLDAQRSLRRIQEDFGRINFLFTDWNKAQMQTVQGYPNTRVKHRDIPLLGLVETETWIKDKLRLIQKYKDVPESQLPECTDEELWRSEPSYKYYSDPVKAQDPTARSSKNFDNLAEANAYCAEKGKGIVITKLGEPKACGFCPAFDGCTQKDRYL